MTSRSAPPAPGPRNALCDVPGVRVGHVADERSRSGVTLVLCPEGAVGGVDVRGGAPGGRETDALDPGALAGVVHAVALSGGSVFGLAAAEAACAELSAAGVGLRLGDAPPVPILPAAILFDLTNGGDKEWGATPPYAALGRTALARAQAADDAAAAAVGSVGAGRGARAGALQGGLGQASLRFDDPLFGAGVVVGALVAVNPIGSTVMPGGRAFWAWPFEIDGEFGGVRPDPNAPPVVDPMGPETKLVAALDPPGSNTAIGVVAVSAALSRQEAQRVAIMAQDGLARAIRPSHTGFDGDTLFAIAAGGEEGAAPADRFARAGAVSRLGSAAADCVARAVARGVWAAVADPGGPPAWRDVTD